MLVSGDVSYMRKETFVHLNAPLFDEVLHKPFSFDKLKRVMEKL